MVRDAERYHSTGIGRNLGEIDEKPKTNRVNYFGYSPIDRACAFIPGLAKLVVENHSTHTLAELKSMGFAQRDEKVLMENRAM